VISPFQSGRKINLPAIIDSLAQLTSLSRTITTTTDRKKLRTCLDHHTNRRKEKKALEKQG
jgi:hypothetical protein